jgi:tetratricopeptide (TPR) repeat protein
MSSIRKPKKINFKLSIVIISVILILVLGGAGLVQYTKASQVKDGLALGNKYLQEEKHEEAIFSFGKVIKIDGKNTKARVGLAKAYIKIGNAEKAEELLLDSISIKPKKAEPYMELAKLYILENNPVSAIKILTDGYRATNDETINSMLEDIKSKIIIENIEVTIILKENYSLPKEITVIVNNVEVLFPVQWNITSIDTTKVGTNVFTGTLENTDMVVMLTIHVIDIKSIENITATVNQNVEYSLPSKVTATMTDDSTRDVEVIWSPSTADTSKAGSYTYHGTISEYDNIVELTLNVIGIASIENINSTINQNDKYSLPSKVTAYMTDGTARDVEVTWSPSVVDTSKSGSFTYQGTISRYNEKIKLTLNIKAKQNDDYTPEMAIRLAKKHIGHSNNDDVAGTIFDSLYRDGKKYYTVRLYSKSMREDGGSGTIDIITIAKDGSTIYP